MALQFRFKIGVVTDGQTECNIKCCPLVRVA